MMGLVIVLYVVLVLIRYGLDWNLDMEFWMMLSYRNEGELSLWGFVMVCYSGDYECICYGKEMIVLKLCYL